jgi:hypothetical protein
MVLADPEVYDFPDVEVPAFLVLFDEGIPADQSMLASSTESSVPGSGQEAAVFAGGLRRRAP